LVSIASFALESLLSIYLSENLYNVNKEIYCVFEVFAVTLIEEPSLRVSEGGAKKNVVTLNRGSRRRRILHNVELSKFCFFNIIGAMK